MKPENVYLTSAYHNKMRGCRETNGTDAPLSWD